MDADNLFGQIVKSSVNLPVVHVDRNAFMTKELSPYLSPEQISIVLDRGTKGYVDKKIIDKIARECIKYQTIVVCSSSFLAGIPGGWAMAGTIPADVAQFYGNVFAITQKLMYLYGYPDLSGEDGKISDEMSSLLIIFTGLMMGVQGVEVGIKEMTECLAKSAVKKIGTMVLKKSTLFQVAKKVASLIGVKLTRDGFAKVAGKVIPLVGAPISAGVTYFTFMPMCKRLKRYLDEQWNSEIG